MYYDNDTKTTKPYNDKQRAAFKKAGLDVPATKIRVKFIPSKVHLYYNSVDKRFGIYTVSS